MIHDLHICILTYLRKNHNFSLALPSVAIAIDESGSSAPNRPIFTTFVLL